MKAFVYCMSLFWALCASADTAADTHPGKAVYDKYCAACHDNPEQSRARSFETLTRMIPALIQYSLTEAR